jgi:hypothetical protein
MKLIALNFKYFTIPWNVFDFIIVIASILVRILLLSSIVRSDVSVVGHVLGEIIAKLFVNPTILRVVRVARVGRVLRLVKGSFCFFCIYALGTVRLLIGRCQRYPDATLRLSCFHARFIQYWSSALSCHVHIFDLWDVVFRLCAQISWRDGFIQF